MAGQLTEEQIAEFKEAFSLYDKDGNGTIISKELGNAMRSLGQNPNEAELQNIIDEIDGDSNETIDFQEFLSIIAKRSHCHDVIHDIFIDACKVFDKENNGLISFSELKQVFINIGEKLTNEEFDEMVRETSIGKDEPFNYKEFLKEIMSK